MALVSMLTCMYWALILHNDEVTVMEDKIIALIKVTSINVEPFWPGLLAKALANANIGSLICNVGPPQQQVVPLQVTLPPPPTAALAEEKKMESKKEESEESDNDMGFGLFD